jgi:primary-amine oxidase
MTSTAVVDRLQQMQGHLDTGTLPHPFDPLSASEIEKAVSIVRKEHQSLFYNAVTLLEPKKAEMMVWLKNPTSNHRPSRLADVVAIGPGSKVYDGVVDLYLEKILSWELTEGVQPLVSHPNALGVPVDLIDVDYHGRFENR